MNYSVPPQNIKYISESNLDICKKYNHYIDNYMRKLGRPIIRPGYKIITPSEYCDFLNQYILSLRYDEKGLNNFINEMIASCKQDIDDFSWLENDRLCYYSWLSIMLNQVKIDDDIIRINPCPPAMPPLATDLINTPLKLIPSSSDMRAKIVKEYIASLNNDDIRFIAINNIKSAWSIIEKIKVPFKFSIDDEQQINWTWNYILTKLKNKSPWQYDQYMNYIVPTSIAEKYHAIFIIHDYFYACNEDTHKVFCIDYKKALSQKKFREKEGVKSINVQLDIKIKEQLDQLLDHYQYSQQRLLEVLISEHYKSVQHKLDKSNFS
ncbi:hypothetical protein [Gilliamella apis]|uniref:hypothetical protein n=1 Tax=Gilliamella apis TaxID=1970738 RepID=UPI001054C206|nr:hypothetical protein [Gilliamella apis]